MKIIFRSIGSPTQQSYCWRLQRLDSRNERFFGRSVSNGRLLGNFSFSSLVYFTRGKDTYFTLCWKSYIFAESEKRKT